VIVRNTALPMLITVSVDDIARRAYEMYLERGRTDGFDREDWRRAESELKAPAHYSYTSAAVDVRGTTGWIVLGGHSKPAIDRHLKAGN
jgi:hypothetical protein